MSLKLKPNEKCPYSANCKYNSGLGIFDSCKGADQTRNVIFVCNYVSDNGVINEGNFRSKFDETGQMKVVLE